MAGFYQAEGNRFSLFRHPGNPSWRVPQAGALGAILQHWSLGDAQPALVVLPTGVGKTAVAMAAPFLSSARRVLVLVPSTVLRTQTFQRFATQAILRDTAALEPSAPSPRVVQLSKRVTNWDSLLDADVVVALPQCVSPRYYEESAAPPKDLFDLVVVDEAHHAPAPTWNAVLRHFSDARAILLTATPRRRDGRRVPGEQIYYYPLRRALEEGLYQPVVARILEPAAGSCSRTDFDRLIRQEVIGLLGTPEHRTSQLIVRAASIDRAEALVAMYEQAGTPLALVHSRLGRKQRDSLLDELRSGRWRGVAVVGMLIEGFDHPSLRIAAYHDKHKSIETTAQLIGRLARVSPDYPQPSVVVTARDIDVYPELRGVVRALYEEDGDWATILPGIIDTEVEEDTENRLYARMFRPEVTDFDLAAIHPLRRVVVREVHLTSRWEPPFLSGTVPKGLEAGERLAGQQILYAGLNRDGTTLLLVTGSQEGPPWQSDELLDTFRYDLHLVSFRRSTKADQPNLVLVNTKRQATMRELMKLLGASAETSSGDPGRLQRAFDSLARVAVSSVGLRSTYSGTGVPSYKNLLGSRIEGGVRASDASHASLGHAMIQVGGGTSAYTAGVSTAKAKYWETRYTALRHYDDFITDFSDRYWFPPSSPLGPLLPQVSRGRRASSWPSASLLAVEIAPALVGRGWTIDGLGSLDRLELGGSPQYRGATQPGVTHDVHLLAGYPTEHGLESIWEGALALSGEVRPLTKEVLVSRGYSQRRSLSDLVSEHPPSVFFADGSMINGSTLNPPPQFSQANVEDLLKVEDWSGIDIRSETTSTAVKRGQGISVHEAVERLLSSRPRRGRHRWIIGNDGPGEIADYIWLEWTPKRIYVSLWHVKASAGEKPSVRVSDLEEAVAQAIKSRRWLTDAALWGELEARLQGRSYPRAHLLEGNAVTLGVILGRYSRWQRLTLARNQGRVEGGMTIVQPGLSRSELQARLADSPADLRATQVQQLLTVWSEAAQPFALRPTVVCSA